MQSTLLIGGGGFIGSLLASVLVQKGRRVTVVGRSAKPRYSLSDGVLYVQADFSGLAAIKPLIESHSEVVHLAYASVPNTSYDNPLGDMLENLPASVQLFSLVAELGSRLLLVSSGGTVYGQPKVLPINEDQPTNPISPYGVTKLTLEKYASLYHATKGLDVVCVRPANAFGEGQRPFVGQGFISTAMASILKGEPVRIFGEYGTVRDYIHVEDMATGIAAALDHGDSGAIYNLGSGIGRSNLDIIEALTPLMIEIGCQVSVFHEPERPIDVRANVLNSDLLKTKTGWQPKVDFVEGLRRTRRWLLENYG
jgi:UDP-glucose 4-epimerase